MNKLDLFEVFEVSTTSNKNCGIMIKIGKYKIPYNHNDAASDYMQQAMNYVETVLKLNVLGTDRTKIVASSKNLKIIETFEVI